MAQQPLAGIDLQGDLRTEEELVRRIRQGDTGAFERLLHLYWDDLLGYAESLTLDRDAAKDAVQDVFARLWERREEWRSDCPVRLYLFRAVRNRIIDAHRRSRVWERWRMRWSGELRWTPRLPDSVFEETELAAELERAIASLPERRREIFVLAHLQDFTYREIAELLDLSPQTVANHMSLALRDLRRRLGRRLGGGDAVVGEVGA